jgi:hypothetical protein
MAAWSAEYLSLSGIEIAHNIEPLRSNDLDSRFDVPRSHDEHVWLAGRPNLITRNAPGPRYEERHTHLN